MKQIRVMGRCGACRSLHRVIQPHHHGAKLPYVLCSYILERPKGLEVRVFRVYSFMEVST